MKMVETFSFLTYKIDELLFWRLLTRCYLLCNTVGCVHSIFILTAVNTLIDTASLSNTQGHTIPQWTTELI